ncbi:D-tyrosyl-tRNA(Tyr) deacylase [Legionella birminghamensis]|uniref:D-aminoacyl-tRNA deacylase n=1 Tax=Legionella birminghamensis TaxID=28083 RepID=A0A378ICQ8_9GAMM|nr:D-aminoacyl-tRNA deacylase [Legionella birminghamensis]KTC71621.1 D-tyrosyl-tRNA(Tyr) deacylase [Legionella birminghamensis]STX32542.1 D-tyrosyl-tRNA(Tyr) deacylase [Legionella birminghamensis]
MLTVIQVVREARVAVKQQVIGEIGRGLLILCGFGPADTSETLKTMLDKCLNFRIFSDAEGKMNLNLKQVEGGLLLVPQFTLLAETRKGLRPSFSNAAPPKQANALFNELIQLASEHYSIVAQGQFGADMQVHLCNDGPVTFVMEF